MLQQVFLSKVALPTFATFKRLFSSVSPVVYFEVIFAEKSFVTRWTLDGPFLAVF